jgi:hypothetical protein
VSEQNFTMQICTLSQRLQRSRRIGDDSPVRLVRLSNEVKSLGQARVTSIDGSAELNSTA